MRQSHPLRRNGHPPDPILTPGNPGSWTRFAQRFAGAATAYEPRHGLCHGLAPRGLVVVPWHAPPAGDRGGARHFSGRNADSREAVTVLSPAPLLRRLLLLASSASLVPLAARRCRQQRRARPPRTPLLARAPRRPSRCRRRTRCVWRLSVHDSSCFKRSCAASDPRVLTNRLRASRGAPLPIFPFRAGWRVRISLPG